MRVWDLTWMVVLLGLCSSRVEAQCTKDADCKGDRVCQQGECVEPGASPAPTRCERDTQCPGEGMVCRGGNCVTATEAASMPPPPQRLGTPQQLGTESRLEPPGTGWATGAAIMGFVFSGITIALAGASAGTVDPDTPLPAAPLSGVAILNTIVMTPVVSTGGASARRLYPGIQGSPGLRIAAWVAYGISIAEGISLLVLAIPEVDAGFPHPALVATCGLLGMASIVLMSADSLVSRSEAIDYYHSHGGVAALELDEEPNFEFAPVLAPVFDLGGRNTVGATVGLAGRF